MADIRDDDGLTPEEEPVDQIIEGEVIAGETGPDDGFLASAPAAPAPVSSWSEVDPSYAELLSEDEEPEDVDEETLDELEPGEEDPTGSQGPRWVAYEIWGRDLNRDTPWALLGTEDFDGDAELEVDSLPSGTRMEFRVRLVDSDGRHSAYSVALPYDTPTDMTAPSRPVGVWARNEMGLVLMGWDGDLEDGIPEDFSHVQFYARQMHPAGNPGGEPGDPRRLETLTEAGSRTTIALIDRIPHEIWATAVDTTGNESLWSEIVEVTPARPVDVEGIEEELEAARQERQEYRDAFDERTSEYDRLMAEQEDALAESDAWSHTALYRADAAAAESAAARVEASEAASQAQDAQAQYEAVSSRQDASEAEIEAARQEAAAAHEAAGEARQYAASIADQVDGIGKTIRSTSPPSGTANEGDYWRQFNTMARDRRLIGWWEYRDGAWDRLSLDVTVLPMAEIGQLVVDDARAQRIFAEVGEISRLAVGDFENLLPESMLWEYREQGLSSVSWQATTGGATGWTTITDRDQHPIRLRWQGSQHSSGTSRLAYGGRDGQGIPVKPGDQFHLSMDGWNGTSGLSVNIRYSTEDLSYVSRLTAFDITSDSPSGSWVVPNNTAIRRMQVEFTGGSTAAGGNADFGDIEFRRIQAGELTVDGLLRASEGAINRLFSDTVVATSVWSQIVRTRLLEADEALIGGTLIRDNAITVDKIAVTDELIFEIARGISLEVGQLASNDIVGMNITGGTITGVEGRWGARYTGGAADGSGVLIRDDGTSGNILIYQDGDPSNQPSVRLGGQRAELNNVSVSGSFRTSNSSGRVEIEESEITYTDVWESTTRTETMPHVSISHASNGGDPALIAADRNGDLVFQPQGGTSSGSLVSRFTGTVESTRFLSNNYQLRTQNTSQPGGIIQSGARTVLMGRPPQEGWATQMFIQGSTSSRNMPTGSTLWSVTYSSPVPQGNRYVQATAETELANNSNHRIAATTISNRTGSGFDIAATPVNGGSVYYRISWLASWE